MCCCSNWFSTSAKKKSVALELVLKLPSKQKNLNGTQPKTRWTVSPSQQLTVNPSDGIHRDLIPGKSFNIKVRGDPGSRVGLVAVDNAVYLLNKDKLTQSKVCVEGKSKERKEGQQQVVLSPTFFRSGTLWRRVILAAPKGEEKTLG